MNCFRFKLLISTKNDAKQRSFKYAEDVRNMEDELSALLSIEDMSLIKDVTEKAREAMFVRSKEKH